jgi:hypothetical protein
MRFLRMKSSLFGAANIQLFSVLAKFLVQMENSASLIRSLFQCSIAIVNIALLFIATLPRSGALAGDSFQAFMHQKCHCVPEKAVGINYILPHV